MKKILLLSPYHAQSHQFWCDNLIAQFPQYEWKLLALPPRFFNWRIRGNSLSWAFSQTALLDSGFDLIIATSMTDLNGLIGFKPALGQVPTLLYFHENQFAYPVSHNARDNIEPKLVPVYAALSVSKICFNTQYNFDTFMSGVGELFKRLPDQVPSQLVDIIADKSCVLPVPIRTVQKRTYGAQSKQFTIVWNHRWEYDKWPECFFTAMDILADRNLDFRLNILGQQFKEVPKIFTDVKHKLANRINLWGFQDSRQAYLQTLEDSHIVVSTAIHDFQGLAVLDAVSHGCIPVVPDRLAYQQIFEEKFRYKSYDDLQEQATCLANHINDLYDKHKYNEHELAPDVSHLMWSNMKVQYEQLLENLLAKNA